MIFLKPARPRTEGDYIEHDHGVRAIKGLWSNLIAGKKAAGPCLFLLLAACEADLQVQTAELSCEDGAITEACIIDPPVSGDGSGTTVDPDLNPTIKLRYWESTLDDLFNEKEAETTQPVFKHKFPEGVTTTFSNWQKAGSVCDASTGYPNQVVPGPDSFPSDGTWMVCVSVAAVGEPFYGRSPTVDYDGTAPVIAAMADVTTGTTFTMDATITEANLNSVQWE